MSDPLGAGGDATARLDRLVAETRAKAERYRAMQAAVGQVTVTESSKDGMVTVTVDSAGNVTDLRITDRVRELTGSQVASAVLTTLRRAQARLPERLGEVMADTIGDDERTRETIVGNYRAKFPEPEPEEPEPAPEPVRKIGAIDEDRGDESRPPERQSQPERSSQPERQAPPPERQTPQPRPSRPARDDDDDDGWNDQSFLVRG